MSDLRRASESLATLTTEIGGSVGPHKSLATITEQLPIYSGLVEAARADNRQALPVGAAYMRQASLVLTSLVLPAAEHLFAIEARQLNDDYRSGTGADALVVLAVAIAVSLALLVLTQIYLARISRRILNLPALIATGVFATVSVWSLSGLAGEGSALATAQHRGSDPVELLSATTVLLSRARTDESLALVNRGSDETDPADFTAVIRSLAPRRGLIGQVSTLAQQTGTSAPGNRLALDFMSYQAQVERIDSLESSGELGAATREASSSSAVAIENRLSDNLAGQIASAQTRFTRAAQDARNSLSGLSVAIPVLTAISAALALIGLRQRLAEYR
jgi:hypothetical protein